MNNLLDAIIAAKLAGGGGGGGGGGSGMTEEFKQALLECFNHVAWTDEHGQDYVDALQAALYPIDHITAVYTQSGTVYDTDSLDSLRADLVVTAFYQGGNSKTVTDYTLIGTLTVGTSTITVSYGGKTATFDVTVTESLVPAGYTAFDYLKRSSESDDYIETPLVHSPSFAVLDCDFWFEMFNNPTANGGIMGCRETASASTNKNEFAFYGVSATYNKVVRSSTFGTPVQDIGTYQDGVLHHVKYRFNSGNAYVIVDDDEPVYLDNAVAASSIPAQTTYGLFLCAVNTGGNHPSGGLITNTKIRNGRVIFYESGTQNKVYDFVPAYNGTKYGYYERVNGVFYPQKNSILEGGNY